MGEPIGMEKVLADIKQKRQRQVVVHKRDRLGDDMYVDGQLTSMALAFAQAAYQKELGLSDEELQVFWPWEETTPKLEQSRRELLINAAALLVADIERLDRLLETQQNG